MYEIGSLGGNPICNKIENPVLSSTCLMNPLYQALPGMIYIIFILNILEKFGFLPLQNQGLFLKKTLKTDISIARCKFFFKNSYISNHTILN